MIVWSPVLYSSEMILFLWLYCLIKGRIPLQNHMNFWKTSKRPLTTPPHFWKIMFQFLYNGYARRYEGHIVWNVCTCLLQSVSCFYFSHYNCITPISGNHVHAFHSIRPSYFFANATISIVKNLQYNFPKMRGGRESKAIWNFFKKSSDLVAAPFP